MSTGDSPSLKHRLGKALEPFAGLPDIDDLTTRAARRRRRRRVGGLAVGLTVTVVLITGLSILSTGQRPLVRPDSEVAGDAPAPDTRPLSRLIPTGGWLIELETGSAFVVADGPRTVMNGIRPYDISPDGSTAVGTSTETIEYPGEAGNESTSLTRHSELIAVSLASGERRVLARADTAGTILGPIEWSPDGSRVAYRHSTWAIDPETQHPGDQIEMETVCVAEADGSGARCFEGIVNALSFDWAPGADSLIVGLSDGAAIEQVNVETGVTQVVMPQGGSASVVRALNERGWDTIYAILNPTSSPSGKYIAALAQTNGGSVPVVTDSAGSFVAAGVPNPDAQAMAWNPTEDVLAYSTGVLIPPSPAQNDWTVELLTPSNGTNRRLAELTSTDELILGLEWSPDGTVLAVNGSRIENQDLVVLLEARTGVVLDRVPIDSEIPASLIDWGPA